VNQPNRSSQALDGMSAIEAIAKIHSIELSVQDEAPLARGTGI
jgi:hypothetical protein